VDGQYLHNHLEGSSMTATHPTSTTEERAVLAVLDAVYAAWADNDADAFVAPYAADATAVHSGTVMPNRDAVRATMAAGFAGALKGSEGIHEVQSVRFVGADTALVLSRGAIRFAGQAEPADASRTLDGWVLGYRDGRWLVEAFHNCPEGP
jgi:uncharacterized protein (TIGR02246 family)